MQVAKRNGKYFTTGNRRLWLFRQLERLGKCGEIPVVEIGSIPSKRFTTKNDGVSVKIRGDARGTWMSEPDCPISERRPPYLCQFDDPPRYLSSTRRFRTCRDYDYADDYFKSYHHYDDFYDKLRFQNSRKNQANNQCWRKLKYGGFRRNYPNYFYCYYHTPYYPWYY